jgi:predicted glycoside hydrolase/deacetylase ChbG (UPF0249 family)
MLADASAVMRIPQLLLLNSFCAFAGPSGTERPDHFCGFFYGGRLTRENLLRVLQHLPATGTFELMCHPGLSDPESTYAEWRYRWNDECDALTDSGIGDYLRRAGIELISHADLVAEGDGARLAPR